MKYQWGRKDSFTFATTSEQWGNGDQRGKFPVKIYTIDGVLIYQDDTGSTNKDKQPVGGIIESLTEATSMMETIKTPIMFYGGNGAVISQVGHTKSLWDYYWTSYSRGGDGNTDNSSIKMNWHNSYLDEYVSKRSKSIYDPCPYGFRVLTNGTYNQVVVNSKWVSYSYAGGIRSNLNSLGATWLLGLGGRNFNLKFYDAGVWGWYASGSLSSSNKTYSFIYSFGGTIQVSRPSLPLTRGYPVRCIERKSPYYV